ncbi:unnamed protein product [Lampetra fluviatilis]
MEKLGEAGVCGVDRVTCGRRRSGGGGLRSQHAASCRTCGTLSDDLPQRADESRGVRCEEREEDAEDTGGGEWKREGIRAM